MTERLNIFHPIAIGGLTLRNNLLAAPMAGLSSLPARQMAIEQGAAMAFSEMVSAEGLARRQDRTRRYLENDERARPFGLQLFGANPDAIGEAVEILEPLEIDLIDLNMGCPVRKVCSKGGGAALMTNPSLARRVIEAARRTNRPLTVKIRAGWDEGSLNGEEIARIAEDAGANAIIVHARTRAQEFRGRADWRHIARVKAAVAIPVIGNGDVRGREDALRMLAETGCDGVMIGRAAVGNPWIFRQILEEADPPSLEERGRMALRHFELLREIVGERLAVLQMRQLISWYAKGLHGAKGLLKECRAAREGEALRAYITGFFGVNQTRDTRRETRD